MRGMGMRHDGWAELVNDEKHGGCMVPIFMLHYEHDEDPEMRPSRSAQKSAKKSSCTWRLGCWGRIAISGSIGRSVRTRNRLLLAFLIRFESQDRNLQSVFVLKTNHAFVALLDHFLREIGRGIPSFYIVAADDIGGGDVYPESGLPTLP